MDVGTEGIQVSEAGLLVGETYTLRVTWPGSETLSPRSEQLIEQLGNQAPMLDIL